MGAPALLNLGAMGGIRGTGLNDESIINGTGAGVSHAARHKTTLCDYYILFVDILLLLTQIMAMQ